MSIAHQAQRFLGACAVLIPALALTACGDDETASASLTLLTPEDGAILTLADDADPSRPGLQLDVRGRSTGLRAETPIELFVDGSKHGASASVKSDGSVELKRATLAPGEHTIYLRTAVGSVQSDDEHTYTFRALVIELPADGDVVGAGDDLDDDTAGIQINVRTQSYAIKADGDVRLFVDGEEVATAAREADGTATFENVTLAKGERTLQARVGSGDDEIVSEDAVIEVLEGQVPPPPPACEGVALLAPTAPGTGAIVLGGNACDSDDHVTTDVRLTIEAEDGTSVDLRLNGTTVATAEVDDGELAFDDVELSNATRNVLTLVVGGEACSVTSRAIQLDCAAPRCVIRAPEPLDVGGTLYLSTRHQTDGAFNIEVESDSEADGEPVALVIDGDEASLEMATAIEVGGDIVALFNGLSLSDGTHTLSARCRDALGNVATTPDVEFVVDTTPCTVAITAPADGAVYLPADDTTPGTDGVQIGAIAAVTGDDCVAVRYGLCTGGELDGDFGAYDGHSPHTALITLADAVTSQSYCLEVEDHVGNVAGDSASFMFRQVMPMVSIQSPATGTSFNVAGGTGYTADAVPATPLCEADVVVACEVGTGVELHHDDANGPLIATADCVASAAAPAGFDGLATFNDAVISDASGDASATLVATQTFSGSSTSLTGVSAAVTYQTDCQAPVVVPANTPCTLHASQQITDEEAAAFVVELSDSTADTETAELSYWIGADVTEPLGTATGTQSGTVAGGAAISFSALDFGGLGPLVVGVVLADDFGNTTEYTCQSQIVDELPQITVVRWPADGAEYGPNDSECDPEGPSEYGIQIEVTIDSAVDRSATLTVNGEEIDGVVIDGTSIEHCVPVPDDSENTPAGPSTIRLAVAETDGQGFDFVERGVSVHTILITDPVADQLIVLGDDCDPGAGFGYEVSVEVDAMHDGSAYTLQADGAAVTGTVSGTTITACVPVSVGGARTFVASIDGTDIEHSVTATVLNDVPMIVSIDAPADGQTFGVGDQTCAAAGIGTYGVLFEATVDQADNREADVLVNGVLVADNVAIGAGGAISVCVDVPDNADNGGDPTTLTLRLTNVLGAPMTDTASVEIDVDTLDIVDPVEDQLITAVNDCDTGTGFGYEVEIAVDPAHLGRTYSIAGGALASTGVITDDSITACVALTPATGVVITASIVGTSITESVTVDVEDAPPAILAITAPANDASFGPGGQTCATAGAGNYGIRVQATVDQADNRLASVLVNGAVAVANAPITGDAIDVCVAVPDNLDHAGPSTITVRLEEEAGDRFDTESVTVNVDKLNITAPAANQHFGPADDCDAGAGFGIPVSIAVDASLDGASFVVDGGSTTLTGTVAGSPITGCLAVTSATTAITASITGSAIAETVAVTVFTGGAPTIPVTFTRSCPETSSPSYREDDATLTWGDLGAFENYEGQFATLQMRCAHTGLGASTPDAWWTAAIPYTLPGDVTVASTGMPLPFRIGEARFCALRAANEALQLTPANAPVDVTCGFRSVLLHTGTRPNGSLGASAAPVGDVNGDGIDDVVVGGGGLAELFLGRTGAWPGSPDTVFASGATNIDRSTFGFRVTSLGDINDDGLQDFAISDTTFDTDQAEPHGRLSIFLGRPSWPATVTMTAACAADLCFDHSGTRSGLSVASAGLGDFDGDGIDDIAVGASAFPMGGSVGQLFIVRGDRYERRACDAGEPTDCRANETCTAGVCALNAGSTFWGLSYELPSGNWINTPSGTPEVGRLRGWMLDGVADSVTQLGRGMAAVGPLDSAPGNDLVVAATGRTSPTPAVTSKLFFLSGRAHPGTAGMTALSIADLGFRDGNGVPSGTWFHDTTTNLGNFMAATGNVYDVPGAGVTGVRDLLVKRSSESGFYLYPGDRNFNPADRINVRGASASDLGSTVAMGYNPALPLKPGLASPELLTDFDGDGRPEVLAGTRGLNGAPGSVYLIYADAFNATNIVAGAMQYTVGSQVQPDASAGTDYRIVEAAGDLNDDGHPDLIVGNRDANAFQGEVYLLY